MDSSPPHPSSFDACRAAVTRMARERAPYAELSDVIDTAGLSPTQVAELWLLAWAQSETEARIDRAVAMARRPRPSLSLVDDAEPG